ncbi:MAG: transaldolase [Rhodocyclaceae bacterium]|nr:transaldolase [Rhodocyclaceae bacterium]
MTNRTQATSRIAATTQLGQQIWLDTLSRALIESGTLAAWIRDHKVAGLTSNPAIFQQALSKDPAYGPAIAAARTAEADPEIRFETVVLPDIQAACDLFRPIWEATDGAQGYVSFEVSPTLAHDAQGTLAAAVRLWKTIDRPNAMIKIPATPAGCQAVTEAIGRGINVNVTLIFSHEQLAAVQAAHQAGLRRWVAHCQQAGTPECIGAVASVASFFVSRTDNILDPKLPPALQGKTAIALCKTAYQEWQADLAGNMADLLALGAKPQWLLWASTSVKNPAYRDTLYVDELIGPQTVNTVPDATLAAFRDHGQVAHRLDQDVHAAHAQLAGVNALGIDLEQVGQELQNAGLAQFETAYADLLKLV